MGPQPENFGARSGAKLSKESAMSMPLWAGSGLMCPLPMCPLPMGPLPRRVRRLAAALLVCAGGAVHAADPPAPAAPTPTAPASAPTAPASAPSAAASAPAAALRGTAAIVVAPNEDIDFGSHALGSSLSRVLTLSPGADAAAVGTYRLAVQGDFDVAPKTCELVRGGSCAVTVTFNALVERRYEGALVVTTDADKQSRVLTRIAGDATGACTGHACEPAGTRVIAGVLAAYVLLFFVIRWNLIALPHRSVLRGQLSVAQATVAALPDDARKTRLLDRIETIKRGIDPCLFCVLDKALWSRGHEIEWWRGLHDIEVELIDFESAGALTARLEAAKVRHASGDTYAKDLAARIEKVLAASSPPPPDYRLALARDDLMLAQQLRRDADRQLYAWHRKSTWLVIGSAGLIGLLASTIGNEVLFLVGATGGLLSRLQRAVTEATSRVRDTMWTDLFLSPLLGALTGWGGVMLISMGVLTGFLGDGFKASTWSWSSIHSPVALGAALLFGFAERLFSQIAGNLGARFPTSGTQVPTTPPTAPPPPPPAAPAR